MTGNVAKTPCQSHSSLQQVLNPRASGKWRQKQTTDDHRLWGSMFVEYNRQSSQISHSLICLLFPLKISGSFCAL